jgi:hypothetical protein
MRFAPITMPLDKKRVELVQSFTVKTPWGIVSVYPGFVYDGASMPRLAQLALGMTRFGARVRGAAIVHDYLYRYQEMTRKESDKVYAWILTQNGVTRAKAWASYRALRMFGGLAWRKNKT